MEIADFLKHICKHPEDFEIGEITEILKEAAEIIYGYAGDSQAALNPGIIDLEPAGQA